MKVRCYRYELSNHLNSIAKVVATNQTNFPILKNFLIKASDQLEVLATDIDVSTRIRIDKAEIEEPGSVAINGEKLNSLLKEIPGNMVSIESTDRGAMINSDGYKFSLIGDSVEEFPEIPQFQIDNAIEVPREEFLNMLSRIRIASSQDVGRYQLCGVFIEAESETLMMTATDGKRLATDMMTISSSERISSIVPNRSIVALIKILSNTDEEKIKLAIKEKEVQVDFATGQLMSNLIEGKFPDYGKAIPEDIKTVVTIPKEKLLSAIKSSTLVIDRITATIDFDFKEECVTLGGHSSDIGESKVQVPIYPIEGDPVNIKLNPFYFLDALKVVSAEDVRLEFCGDQRPVIVRDGMHYRHLLMPLVNTA